MFNLKLWLVDNGELRMAISLRELRMETTPENISTLNSLSPKQVFLTLNFQCLAKTRIENGEKQIS